MKFGLARGAVVALGLVWTTAGVVHAGDYGAGAATPYPMQVSGEGYTGDCYGGLEGSAWAGACDSCDSCGTGGCGKGGCGLGGGGMGGWLSGCGCGGGCGNFFFGAGGLILTRTDDDSVLFVYDDANGNNLLTSRSAGLNWAGGFQANFGMYFNGGCNAIQAVYWGVYPNTTSAAQWAGDATGNLATPLVFDSLRIDPNGLNQDVANYFNNAEFIQYTRYWGVQNIELNVLGLAGFGCGGCGCSTSSCSSGCSTCGGAGCSSCSSGGGAGRMGGFGGGGWGPQTSGVAFSWLLGPRFLRFSDGFCLRGDQVDTTFDGNDEELEYCVGTRNSLVGFQFGGQANACLGCRLSLSAGAKAGVFGNSITSWQGAQTLSQITAEVNDPNSPFNGQFFDVTSHKKDVSLLAELNVGAAYRVSRCWSANIGYRAVGISGLALSQSQIPRDFFDNIAGIQNVKSNGNVILHGAYAGLTFNY